MPLNAPRAWPTALAMTTSATPDRLAASGGDRTHSVRSRALESVEFACLSTIVELVIAEVAVGGGGPISAASRGRCPPCN
jgi:hypothetical protein